MNFLAERWRQVGWRTGVLVALVLAAYAPALRGGFVWDDALLIDKNPLVLGTMNWHSIWFQTDFPLTSLAFWLEWLLWGKTAAAYHAVNVLLHALGSLLVWRVLARLEVRGAWLGALLFAVHPVAVASAGWISELKNVLSLPFFLLSLDGYLRFETGDPGGSRSQAARWYRLSLLAFLLALLSKTSTVMLPVVLLACCWWRRGRVTRTDALRTTPYFLMALGFGLLSIWFQAHQAGAGTVGQVEGMGARLAGAGAAIWFYLGKAILPLNLSFIYPRWSIDSGSPGWYLPGILLVVSLLVLWRFRAGWGRPGLFALGCFAALLFPVLGFFDMYFLAISRVSDHLQYLPLIAPAGLAGAGLSAAFGPRWRGVVGAGLVLGLSVATFRRAGIVAHEELLWRDTLARNPQAWTARNNLGCLLAEKRQFGPARAQFEAALKFNPQNAQAHCNLARLLALQGQPKEAEDHFRTALEIKPLDADIRRSFASVLAGQGRAAEAVAQLQEAVRVEPATATRLELSGLLYQLGRAREAVAQYRLVVAAAPDSAEALNNLAWLLATSAEASLRDGAEAVRLAERANRLAQGREVMPLGTLAAAYAETGRFTDAVATAQKACDLATTSGQERMAGLSRQLLGLYQAGKPFHQPAANP